MQDYENALNPKKAQEDFDARNNSFSKFAEVELPGVDLVPLQKNEQEFRPLSVQRKEGRHGDRKITTLIVSDQLAKYAREDGQLRVLTHCDRLPDESYSGYGGYIRHNIVHNTGKSVTHYALPERRARELFLAYNQLKNSRIEITDLALQEKEDRDFFASLDKRV